MAAIDACWWLQPTRFSPTLSSNCGKHGKRKCPIQFDDFPSYILWYFPASHVWLQETLARICSLWGGKFRFYPVSCVCVCWMGFPHLVVIAVPIFLVLSIGFKCWMFSFRNASDNPTWQWCGLRSSKLGLSYDRTLLEIGTTNWKIIYPLVNKHSELENGHL